MGGSILAYRWGASAPGFDPTLAGEVVLVAATGRFATSEYKRIDTEVFAKVEATTYDILVMSYSSSAAAISTNDNPAA